MASLALMLSFASSASGYGVAAASAEAIDGPAEREVEFARLLAHVDRVVAELSAAPGIESSGRKPAPCEWTVEHARVLAHFERVMSGVSLEQPTALRSEAPARGLVAPLEGDRSDAVMALLAEAAGGGETGASAIPAIGVPVKKPVSLADGDRRVIAAAATPALSGTAASGTAAVDSVEENPIVVLQDALRARDAVIADLLRRVEQLEHGTVLSDAQLDQTVGGAGPISLLRRPTAAAETAPEVVSTPAAAAEATDEVQVVQAQATDTADEAAQPAAAPGQFEVNEDQIERALERTLVQEGALLLPFGQAEIEPSFAYTRRENKVPAVIDGQFLGEQQVRRNEFDVAATFRVGLPFDSQIEVGVPYNIVDQSNSDTVGGATQNSNSETGNGLGDISVGLAKTLLREGEGWWPDVIARVTYDSDSGDTTDNGVFLGGGFNELSGSLSFVKRQDPLAFVADISYSKTFENDDIEPGDEVGFSIGTVLAASPETSLSFFFNQTFADDAKVDGDKIGGTDQVIGTFSIGAATILGSNMLLSVTGEIGLTDDAPDYAIGVALPIRFNLPTF